MLRKKVTVKTIRKKVTVKTIQKGNTCVFCYMVVVRDKNGKQYQKTSEGFCPYHLQQEITIPRMFGGWKRIV